jgi:hypothetical protein
MKDFFGTPLAGYAPPLVLLVLTIVYLVTGYEYSAEARAFPVTVAWAMLALVALDLVSRTKTPIGASLIRTLNPAAAPEKVEHLPRYSLLKQLAAIGWVLGFVSLMVLVGILYAVPVYVFASMFVRGRRALWLCAAVAAAATLFIWFLFERVLMLELYTGILFGAL